MTVNTGGPVRGLLGRWLMRLEAAGAILRMAFLGVTAASTFTSALIAAGYDRYALPLLTVGTLASFLFAFLYVETGIFNRKNRERMDRGDNFAGPGMTMNQTTQAVAFGAALEAFENGDDPRAAAERAATEKLRSYRDGVDIQDLLEGETRP